MFVMASLAARTGGGPVKVRNLSSVGALVEGGVLPEAGERVSLQRGSLHTDGEVVWCKNGRAGLRFTARVTVADWLPKGANQAGQQRTDSIFSTLKERAAGSAARTDVVDLPPSPVTREDLSAIIRDLDALAEALADDDLVLIRYSSKMQVLDAANQALRKLLEQVPSSPARK